MLRKTWSLLALAALGSMVFANVDLRTNIQDIYYRGTCEEAGAVTMSVNGNDFFTASTSTPVYIRVRLDKGGKLCQTLVDATYTVSGTAHTNYPIYLAMRIEGSPTTTILANPATVSIVRWIAGETELWLRVQSSSNTWVAIGGVTPSFPDIERRVAWTFGITARESVNRYFNTGDFTAMRANLPCNTPNIIDAPALPIGFSVSTLFCVDVSESILNPMPAVDSELQFDTISFDFQTQNVQTAQFASQIVLGSQTTANFSGDDTIARGFNYPCSVSTGKSGRVYANLCLDEGGTNEEDFGLVCMTNYSDFTLNCAEYGFPFGSEVDIYAPDDANYGFRVWVDNAGDPVEIVLSSGTVIWFVNDVFFFHLVSGVPDPQGGTVLTLPSYSFSGGGTILTRLAIALYEGISLPGPIEHIRIQATVCANYNINPTDVELLYAVFVANKEDNQDVAPFDGTGDNGFNTCGNCPPNITANMQQLRCPISYIFAGAINWDFGAFLPCVSDAVRLFYPYLPKLVDTDFWAGVAFVNQGCIDFDDGEVEGRAYESDGSRWDVAFPALPVRNMQTYLVADGDQGVGFYDSDNGIFLPVESATGDLVPLDTRFSMFVRGQHVGTSFQDTLCPDLDGFALIGNTVTNVVYGYLPRNFEVTAFGAPRAPFQDGSLPVLSWKSETENNFTQIQVDKKIIEEVRNLRR
jgi:hypothetical protein